MGVFIISPTDKGGMLHQPPRKMRDPLRAAFADPSSTISTASPILACTP